MKACMLKGIAMSLLIGACAPSFASEDEFDIEARNRAKIAKEKVRHGALIRQGEEAGSKAGDNANCGSQNIGNVNANGRPGTAPREVFVFAPNAINLVTARGCR